MIVEGGRTRVLWGFRLFANVLEWLINLPDEILIPRKLSKALCLIHIIWLVFLPFWKIVGQNCDVDFPGTSVVSYSQACGGGLTDNLSIGKNTPLGDNDKFTFDSPATINIQSNLDILAQGDGSIVIPAGVTVIVDGNMQLNPDNGGCESGNACTLTIQVDGYLVVAGHLQNNLRSLVWEGSGTVEVQGTLTNNSNGCMSCELLSCPTFPASSGGCEDSGSGCGLLDFCATNYGNGICLLDIENPIIRNCPSDIVAGAMAGSCEAQVTWDPPSAIDNCNVATFTSSHSPGDLFPLGLTEVTYTATDGFGNTGECSFQVEVKDFTSPLITGCPASTVIAIIDLNESSASVTWIEPAANDNCGVSSFTSTHNPGDIFQEGQTVVSYTALDETGNNSSCSFIVEVSENSPPTAQDVFIETNSSEPVSICFEVNGKQGDNVILSDINYDAASGLVDQIDAVSHCFVYTSTADFTGKVEITATICDDRSPPGCSEVRAIITVLPRELTIYKAFSPNGDAINDLWFIGNIEQYPDNTVTIFDRWGGIIYQASGYNNENIVWDGRSNGSGLSTAGTAPTGTYFYSIKLKGYGSKSGYVELIN